MTDRCDVAGCEEAPALYGPSGRRCLAHVPREMAAGRRLQRTDPIGTVFTMDCWGPEYFFSYHPELQDGRNALHPDGTPCTMCFEEWAVTQVVSLPMAAPLRSDVPAAVDLHDPGCALHTDPERGVCDCCPCNGCDGNGDGGHRLDCEAFAPKAGSCAHCAEAEEDAAELAERLIETNAALAASENRLAEVERVLTRWPWDGAAALRVLRGEPIVRERGETTTDEEMTR